MPDQANITTKKKEEKAQSLQLAMAPRIPAVLSLTMLSNVTINKYLTVHRNLTHLFSH